MVMKDTEFISSYIQEQVSSNEKPQSRAQSRLQRLLTRG